MRPHPRQLVLPIFSTLTVMLLCPALRANGIVTTIALGGGYSYSQFTRGLVAPYSGNVVGNGVNLYLGVFCLDADDPAPTGPDPANHVAGTTGILTNLYDVIHGATGITGYPTQTTTVVNEEQEAAFLASYALAQGAKPTGDNANVSTREGPISMAIWQTMQTLGGYPPDSNAAPFIALAQNNLSNPTLNNPDYLRSVTMWIPVTISGNVDTFNPNFQRFMTEVPFAAPEPGTSVLMGTGVLLIALSRIRRRR
jgi:hypothetical protein